MRKKHDAEKVITKLLKVAGITMLILAALLIVLLFLMRIDKFQIWYTKWLVSLEQLENQVASLQERGVIILVQLLLFLLRCMIPVIPMSVLYVISGMVFPKIEAIIINFVGMFLGIMVRYYTGYQMGEGYTLKQMRRSPLLTRMLEDFDKGSPLLLLIFRTVPVFPSNSVSSIYGSLHFPFKKYLIVSGIGTLPRLVVYAFIGSGVYNPLSTSLIIPLAFLLIMTGTMLISLRGIITAFFAYRDRKHRRAAGDAGLETDDSSLPK